MKSALEYFFLSFFWAKEESIRQGNSKWVSFAVEFSGKGGQIRKDKTHVFENVWMKILLLLKKD